MAITISGSSGIVGVNGTASAPGTTGADTDTGIYYGTNTVGIATNGTARLFVDASGSIGVGVTPTSWGSYTKAIEIGGVAYPMVCSSNSYIQLAANAYFDNSDFRYISSGAASRYMQNGGAHYWGVCGSGTAGNVVSFTQVMTLDASGNLGINTSSPSGKLQIRSGTDLNVCFNTTTIDAATASRISSFNDAVSASKPLAINGSPLVFQTEGLEQVRIDTSGNVGIGASPSYKLHVAGDVYVNGTQGFNATNETATLYIGDNASYLQAVFDGGLDFYQNSTFRMRLQGGTGHLLIGHNSVPAKPTTSATIVAGSLRLNPDSNTSSGVANVVWSTSDGVFYRSTSSLRYKRDIQDAVHGLQELLQLRPVTFKGKSPADGEKIFSGFISEEVDEIGLTEFVVYDDEGRPDSLAYAQMTSICVKSIQQIYNQFETLKTEFEEYKRTHP